MKLKSAILRFLSGITAGVFLVLSMTFNANNNTMIHAESTEEYIFNFLTQRIGYNSAVACGFLANIYRESSFNTEADNGYAYGLIQWEGGRRTNLISFCEENGYDISSVDAQLLFIQHELQGQESGSVSSFINQPETSEGAYWAAYYICYNYERPANKAWKSDDRGKIARDTYWTMFGERTAQITPDEPIAPYPRPTGLVKIGMKGDSVRWVQYALNVHLGYDIGESGIDGDFGDATETAVATFQVEHGLTPYGYVDEETRNLIVEKVQEILSNNNPVGYLDSATGGEKCVTVTGWAYDADTPEEPCEVHIYMDGPAGQGICVATGIIANLPSPDVNEVLGYPGNHRYEATISIDATGEHTFFAHAINRGGGNVNSLLEQSFTTTISDVPHGSEMASGAGQTILNGDYAIFSAIYPDLYLDIYGTDLPATDTTNVIIHTQDVYTLPNAVDCWTVEYLNNGFYKIHQKGSDACLDVAGESLLRGTNVMVHHDNGGKNQQWSIQPTEHGYIIQSRCNSYCLNVEGGRREDLTNVQVWENDGTKAQYFCFVPLGTDNDRPLEDGEYKIKLAKDTNFCIDCNGTSEEGYSEGTNVTLWNAKQSEDIYKVTYVGDGYYTIAEKSTGYVLDIEFGFNDDEPQNYLDNCRNIALFKNYNSRNQKWMIKPNADGSYFIISQLSGYCLEDYGCQVENGANISQYYINGTDAQKWKFVAAIEKPTKSELKADKSTAFVGEMITFTAESDTATSYTIEINKDGERLVTQSMPNGKLSLSFDEAGEYSAYVTSSNAMGYEDSQRITFKIEPYELNMYETEKHTIVINGLDLTYKSSNNNVAVVSKSGIITALGEGSAVISIINSDGDVTQIKVNVTSSNSSAYLAGDANEDGKVSISDAVAILQYLANAEKYSLSEQGKLNADVDGTAGVSGKDAAAIQQYDAGIIASLPL